MIISPFHSITEIQYLFSETYWRTSVLSRFYSRIHYCKHGPTCAQCCHIWKPALQKSIITHGHFYVGSILGADSGHFYIEIGAHVFAYLLYYGTMLYDYVLHECDYPPCCNYAHLSNNTQAANIQDSVNKKRFGNRKNEYNNAAKLTPNDIHYIWDLFDEGHTRQGIAIKLHLSRSHVTTILNGSQWHEIYLQRTNQWPYWFNYDDYGRSIYTWNNTDV